MTETERLRAALLHIRATAAGTKREKVDATLHLIMSQVDAALAPPQPTPDTRPVLTDRQAEVLAYIKDYRRAHEFNPSYDEIATSMGFAHRSGVVCHIKALRSKGYLQWVKKQPRTLSVVEAS